MQEMARETSVITVSCVSSVSKSQLFTRFHKTLKLKAQNSVDMSGHVPVIARRACFSDVGTESTESLA